MIPIGKNKTIEKCRQCENLFAYDSNDIHMDIHADAYIECPFCKHKIYI